MTIGIVEARLRITLALLPPPGPAATSAPAPPAFAVTLAVLTRSARTDFFDLPLLFVVTISTDSCDRSGLIIMVGMVIMIVIMPVRV